MQPAGELMIEHRLIEHMLRLMNNEIDRIGRYGRVDADFIDDAVDFMRTYTDECHHGKEERILFPALARKPLTDELRRVMNELIQEHAFARKTVEDIETAKERYLIGQRNAPADVISALNTITEFYPHHIDKEDHHFFIPAMGYLSAGEKDRMLEEFEDFDARLIQDKYKNMIKGLEGRFMPAAPLH